MSLKDLFHKGKHKEDARKNIDIQEKLPKESEPTDYEANISSSTDKVLDGELKDLHEKTTALKWNEVHKSAVNTLYQRHCDYLRSRGLEIPELDKFEQHIFHETSFDGRFLTSTQKKAFLSDCLEDLGKGIARIKIDALAEQEKAREELNNKLNDLEEKYSSGKLSDEEYNKTKDELVNTEIVNSYDQDKSHIYCFITSDNMVAYIYIAPPIDKTYHVSRDDIFDALKEANIKENIDEAKIMDLLDESNDYSSPTYSRFIRIAKGVQKEDGKDGSITINFDRTDHLNLIENEQGQVDYKSLGKFYSISKDDIIAHIIKPIEGTDGVDVHGTPIKAYVGKEAVIPKSEGTYISDDGLSIKSAIDGYLTYTNGVLSVKAKMIIKGNVDASTGNIIFNGDLEVEGDIVSGYTVDVTGNIKVRGVVEGAILKAGGTISIKQGVSGSNQARLYADGAIKSLFLENCFAEAKEGIFTESIIQSTIYSDKDIDCLRGKGVIIGGQIFAKGKCEANVIGSRVGKHTEFTLGKSFISQSRIIELKKIIESDKATFNQLEKNIEFLENNPELKEKKADLYTQIKEQYEAYALKLKENLEEYETLSNDKLKLDACVLKSGVLYPPVKLTIGLASANINSQGKAVSYHLDTNKNEITQGVYS